MKGAAVSDPLAPGTERRIAVEKRMKRKLDLRCSLFVLIYILNYLDRNNIAAARLRGLQEDLQLSNTEYSTCLSILYVGYILMQVSAPLNSAGVSILILAGPLQHDHQQDLSTFMVHCRCCEFRTSSDEYATLILTVPDASLGSHLHSLGCRQ